MPSAPQKRRPTEDSEAAEAADRQAEDATHRREEFVEGRGEGGGSEDSLDSAVNKKLRKEETDLAEQQDDESEEKDAVSSEDRRAADAESAADSRAEEAPTAERGSKSNGDTTIATASISNNSTTKLPATNGDVTTVVSTQSKPVRAPAPPPPPPAPVPMRVVPLEDVLRKLVRLGDAEGEEHAAEGKILTLGGQIIALVKQDAAAQTAAAPSSKSATAVATYAADCASNMPHKAPLYACLVAVVSAGLQRGTEENATPTPDFSAAVLAEVLRLLEKAVRDGEFVVVKAGLRFLGSLYNVGIFEEAAWWTVVDSVVQASEAACQAAISQPQANEESPPALRLASELLLFADGLMYAVLACLPWAIPRTGAKAEAGVGLRGSKVELLLQQCGQWMEERAMALDQLIASGSLQMECDDDTGQRLYASSALGELWQLICLVHGDMGEGNGSWDTAFATSIPRPCERLPPGALEPRTSIGISAEQAGSFEAVCRTATQRSLSPGGATNPKESSTLGEAPTAKQGSDASAKCVGRDRASWDLDATVRAFQLETTPDGPVYRAYETLSQVEMWVGRDRCNSILARFYPSGKLASRFLLGLQIYVQAPEVSAKDNQSDESTPTSSDSAAAVSDTGSSRSSSSSSSSTTAAAPPSQSKPATKRVEPLIMETVFAHACMTPCHGRRWRMYLLDVAARLCQHTASGDCPNEPGRRCTHKGYGKCLSTAVRAVFAGLPTLSPARRQLFAEWSAAFVAVREHRPTWPWEAMLDGIDFLSTLSSSSSAAAANDDGEAEPQDDVAAEASDSQDRNGGGSSSSSSTGNNNPYREFLQEVATLLSGCTAMPILRGEVVPPELHAFLDAKFGDVAQLARPPHGRVGAMQSDMEELLLKGGKSPAELEAWVALQRQPPPPLTEEEKELEREAGGVFEDRTPPTAWECLRSLLNAAALAARGMLTRHLQLLLAHMELLRKLSIAAAGTEATAGATTASKSGENTLETKSLNQVMDDIVAHTTATLQHCPRRATQVVRFLLMHRVIDFRAVVTWYFAASSSDRSKSSDNSNSDAETAAASNVHENLVGGENWKWEVVDACLGEVCVDEHTVANIFVNRVKAREDSVAAAAAALEGSRGAPQPVKQAWAVRAAEKAAKEATTPFTDEERLRAFGALLRGFVSALSEAAAAATGSTQSAAIRSRFVTTCRSYFHFYSPLGTDKVLEQLSASDSSTPASAAAVRTRLATILRDPFL